MSVAYRTNTAFEYTGYEQREREVYERPAAARDAAHRRVVMARRAVVMVVAVMSAVVCIGLLYVKAQIFMAQRDINTTQASINKVERLNSVLSEQYSETMDINTIMDRASKLGMGYPSANQVLYVNLSGNTVSVEMKKK